MKTTRDISVLCAHEDSMWYTHTCSCGCGEQIVIEVTSSEDIELISIEMYATVTGFNRDCKMNFFSQLFSDAWWKVTTAFKVLFKGQISLQTGICINSKQGVEDYITALTEASNVFKIVDKG